MQLSLPREEADHVVWPQLDFAALCTVSGILPSGTIVVKASQHIAAESVFPCIGKAKKRSSSYSARFCPAAVTAGGSYVIDGSPEYDPSSVAISPASGCVTSASTTPVGTHGWAFFAYCREPPPAVTLSTAAICTTLLRSHSIFGSTELPLPEDVQHVPVIIVKRDMNPGDELLVVFNQFDALGKLWTYPTPSPFVRVPSAVHLLKLPSSMQIVRTILASQSSSAITDSYVKLLEDTAGMDARTTERQHGAILNLTKAVQHYMENDGDILPLPLVVAAAATVAAVPEYGVAPKKQKVASTTAAAAAPAFPASFRIPQSFKPGHF